MVWLGVRSSYLYFKKNGGWYIKGFDGYKESDTKYLHYIDSTNDIETENVPGKWAAGFLDLIENWHEIKTIIDERIEEYFLSSMEHIRKDTEKIIMKYEKVNGFKV